MADLMEPPENRQPALEELENHRAAVVAVVADICPDSVCLAVVADLEEYRLQILQLDHIRVMDQAELEVEAVVEREPTSLGSLHTKLMVVDLHLVEAEVVALCPDLMEAPALVSSS